jgi:hypothetical protein
MINDIKKHIEDRKILNKGLKKIMGYCDDSPITLDFIKKKWAVGVGELRLQVKNYDLSEDYYSYEISSLGAAGDDFFIGEKDGYTYIMAHEESDWMATHIFILDNNFKESID